MNDRFFNLFNSPPVMFKNEEWYIALQKLPRQRKRRKWITVSSGQFYWAVTFCWVPTAYFYCHPPVWNDYLKRDHSNNNWNNLSSNIWSIFISWNQWAKSWTINGQLWDTSFLWNVYNAVIAIFPLGDHLFNVGSTLPVPKGECPFVKKKLHTFISMIWQSKISR